MAENSVFIKFLRVLINAFEHSVVRKLFSLRESRVISFLKKHTEKDSVFRYSAAYKIIMDMAAFVDKIMAALRAFLSKLFEGSEAEKFIEKSRKMKFSAFSFFFSITALTYTVVCIIMRININLAVISVSFVLLALAFAEINIEKLSKTSILAALIKKLFED